jgi:sensor histidine kinase YesM
MKLKTPNIIEKLWSKQVFRHIIYWLCAYGFIYLTVFFWDSPSLAFKISTILILPAPIPVYLHFYVQQKFFKQRRYLLYVLSFIIIVIVSAFIIEALFSIIINEPGSHTSGIATAIFYIVITTGFKYYRDGVKQQILLQAVEFKQVETELALLKSQVNPHFFFNTLNNLYALSLDKSDLVPEVILKISDLMRYVLDSSKKKTVQLSEEIHFLESYVELEKLRLSGEANIQISVSGNINGKKIAPMLLAPLVENSFKHGLSASVKDGFIHMNFISDGNDFQFIIENHKLTPTQQEQNCSSKMGLENMKRRLELLYPESHQLIIEENEMMYKVKLEIRL